MAELNLTEDIAEAIDGAAERGPALVLGYVADDGTASLSFRGSTQVHSKDQLAIWVRKRDDGVAKAIQARPRGLAHLLFTRHSRPGLSVY